MSRVIAEVLLDADRPFRVIPAIPAQAKEIDTLELEHDLSQEDPEATPEVHRIFDRAESLRTNSTQPIVVAVEETHVRFFDQD